MATIGNIKNESVYYCLNFIRNCLKDFTKFLFRDRIELKEMTAGQNEASSTGSQLDK